MLLPIGDTPNPRGIPYVTYLLIAVNVAVFLLISLPLTSARPDLADPMLLEYLRAMGARGPLSAAEIAKHVTAYDLFVFRYGYRPGDPSLLTLFTAMFLHGGLLHLAGNMLFLWIFGDNVEHRLGRVGYLLAYLATGVAATLFFALFVPGSQVPLVGASGAISGVLGCYFLWFPRNSVKVFFFLFPFFMQTVLVPARWVLGFYLLIDNLLPFLINGGGGSGVAHGAHIGGFLAGAGLAFGIDRLSGLRALDGEPKGKADGARVPGADDVSRLLRAGEPLLAARTFLALSGRSERMRVAPAEVLAIGEHLLAGGHHPQALSLFRRFIAERPADPLLDRAYLGAGKAMIHHPRGITSAYQYFLAALDVARSEEVAGEARVHLRAIERLGERK